MKCRFESFNTPGTEVAPGSDVVGKDFQGGFFVFLRHLSFLVRYSIIAYRNLNRPADISAVILHGRSKAFTGEAGEI